MDSRSSGVPVILLSTGVVETLRSGNCVSNNFVSVLYLSAL